MEVNRQTKLRSHKEKNKHLHSKAAFLTSLGFAVEVIPRSIQSSSCTSSCRDDEDRPASLTRLAIMSHCGANILDLAPTEKGSNNRCHGREQRRRSFPVKRGEFFCPLLGS